MSDNSAVVLASASPRRAALLSAIGVSFDIFPPVVDEDMYEGKGPITRAVGLAEAKAMAAAKSRGDSYIVGADTLVLHNGDVLDKPRDQQSATRIVYRINGQTIHILTGLVVYHAINQKRLGVTSDTTVKLRKLSDEDLQRYIHTAEPTDKAGALAVQWNNGEFVDDLSGCPSNALGLPLCSLICILARDDVALVNAVDLVAYRTDKPLTRDFICAVYCSPHSPTRI